MYIRINLILDASNDNMAYESLGPWDRLMDNSHGQRYRLWKYRDGATGEMVVEKFPFHWEDYFSRPSIFPQTPLGNFYFMMYDRFY